MPTQPPTARTSRATHMTGGAAAHTLLLLSGVRETKVWRARRLLDGSAMMMSPTNVRSKETSKRPGAAHQIGKFDLPRISPPPLRQNLSLPHRRTKPIILPPPRRGARPRERAMHYESACQRDAAAAVAIPDVFTSFIHSSTPSSPPHHFQHTVAIPDVFTSFIHSFINAVVAAPSFSAHRCNSRRLHFIHSFINAVVAAPSFSAHRCKSRRLHFIHSFIHQRRRRRPIIFSTPLQVQTSSLHSFIHSSTPSSPPHHFRHTVAIPDVFTSFIHSFINAVVAAP